MAFRMIRQRREQRRTAKLDEIFQDRDKSQTGKISFDQLVDIFRIYQVNIGIFLYSNLFLIKIFFILNIVG